MHSYVARQPIFKKNLTIYAYELLFRDGLENIAPPVKDDTATSELLSSTFLTNDYKAYTQGKKSFINFSAPLLTSMIPLLFPKENTVVEILETVEPNSDVVEACKELSQNGYELALDDFVYRPDLVPLIALADIIKIDFRQQSIHEILNQVQTLKKYNKKLLAEKVETHEEFQAALDMGFDYFQGYFFAKPQIIQGKQLATPKLYLMKIMCELNRPEMDFQQVETFIASDVTISFKLLQYINSAYYRRIDKISSISQAMMILGQFGMRRFLSVIAMSKLAEGKPHELIRISSARARFCELLADIQGCSDKNQKLFTTGLFSLIDAIMDDSMECIIQQLPLDLCIKEALISETGKLSPYLKIAKSYERGNWDLVLDLAKALDINEKNLPKAYCQALEWCEWLTAK